MRDLKAMKTRTPFLLLTLIILVSGCGVLFKPGDTIVSQPAGTNGQVKSKLYSQYKEWRGVGHRMGGLSRKGIDCSGFVYITFKLKFGVRLPRTTEQQSRLGQPVKRSELKAGDLVFFKTSKRVRHVGIYLEKGKFVHASKSRGVMISRLNNDYWKPRYWKAKRLGNLQREG